MKKIAIVGIGYVGLSNGLLLAQHNNVVVIYEPEIKEDSFFNSRNIKDLSNFKKLCDMIITNRNSDELADVKEKIYIRDIFGNN